MNPTILNREFQHPADGWYQIESLGEHPNRAAGVVQVIDVEAARTIVNRFNADAAAAALHHGSELLIDHEHFSDQKNQESRAYGWLQELQNRADGIYGRVRWSATGKAAVDGGDYRFFSTEYDPKDLAVLKSGITNRKSEVRARPLRLAGLSLTNMPNNRGQKPITNRAEPGGSADSKPTNKRSDMKSIAAQLGLSAEASEDAILAEVTKLHNRATSAESQIAALTTERDTLKTETGTIKNRVTELETANTTLLGEQIDADLDAAGIKDETVKNRWKPVLGTLKNRAERQTFLADLAPEKQNLTNRASATVPADKKEEDKPKTAAEAWNAKK